MGQFFVYVGDLPEAPLDAAAHFHSDHVPAARMMLKNEWAQIPGIPEEGVGRMMEADIDALVFVFPSAGKEHRGWRLVAIQQLAREAAPKRVNGLEGEDLDGLEEAKEYLASAPGITGQLLAVDGKSGEND